MSTPEALEHFQKLVESCNASTNLLIAQIDTYGAAAIAGDRATCDDVRERMKVGLDHTLDLMDNAVALMKKYGPIA